MRIKGPNWKRNRCRGQRKVIKAISETVVQGIVVHEMLVCETCGRGSYIAYERDQTPDPRRIALKNGQLIIGGYAGVQQE